MNLHGRFFLRGATAVVLMLVALATPGGAANPRPFGARSGLDVATAGARAWAPDAFLMYVENDEELDDRGSAVRWGYLFYSPSLQKARGYSVREGRILVAENLEMTFEAPRLSPEWIDSGAAFEAAEQGVGRDFRQKHQGRLSSMLLLRGALADKNPDLTTWMLVYTSPKVPSLFVVVDAAEGKVRRTWRG